MIPVAPIIDALGEHILWKQCAAERIPSTLLLLDPNEPLSSRCCYVSTAETVRKMSLHQPVTLLLSSTDGSTDLPVFSGTVILTDLPLAALFNLVAVVVNGSKGCPNRVYDTSAFLSDVLEERLTDEQALLFRERALLKPIDSHICCIVIRCSTPPDVSLQAQIMHGLEPIFPGDNFGIYEQDIVILHTRRDLDLNEPDYDTEQLTDLLHFYHARAGISSYSSSHSSIRSLWNQASEVVHLGSVLQRGGLSDCIYTYQDYGMYDIIDLCAGEFERRYHHNDLTFLVHPAILALCRYDELHNTKLRDVLFHYLTSNCSLNKTAQRLFMHRNTVLNKLNKIDEITHLTLDNEYLRVFLIFSCLIIRYNKLYLNRPSEQSDPSAPQQR